MMPIESVIEEEEIAKEIVQPDIVAKLIANGITIELCNGISSDLIAAIV